MNYRNIILIILSLLIITSCENEPKFDALFTKIDSSKSQVHFINRITESAGSNMLNNNNIYAGGGVAIGDIDNDGLQDFIVISNQEAPGLYLNLGDFKFREISHAAGLHQTSGWNTGVVMEDVNSDGWLDIYISKGIYTDKKAKDRRNLLYINNKDNTFSEMGRQYGIDDSNVTIQSVFFDFDLDGDLDLYTLNHPLDTDEIKYPVDTLKDLRQNNNDAKNSDSFYINQGNNKFKKASKSVGIHNYGNGLGIGLADFNNDGFPDIYITNDFGVDNFFYMNSNGKGFQDQSRGALKHASYFAMGCDLADINNDKLIDIFEVEMLPKDRKRSILNMASMNRRLFEKFEENEFVPQYMRNTLQLNRGIGNFSEIAQIANVAKTDWSWGTLLIDVNDDGYRDILITNGIKNDIKDRDFAIKGNKLAEENGGKLTWEQHNSLIVSTKIPNYAFQNMGNTLFEDMSEKWGFADSGFSNGFSYGDLDNDGDLDLIVNNLEEAPWIYKNNSRQIGNNNINFKLEGNANNLNGIGSKVTIYHNGQEQYVEHFVVRGFQSSSQHIVHFGLKDETKIDSLKIVWPDRKMEIINRPFEANKTYTLTYETANEIYNRPPLPNRYFAGASRKLKINSRHYEIPFDDFEREILLPHKMSQIGPALCTGDANGDGIKDFYVGGARSFPGQLYLSEEEYFYPSNEKLLEEENIYEDIASTFFDADMDGDLDLYVVSGSNEFEIGSKYYQDRLYLNDGTGKFTKDNSKLPILNSSGGCVEAADFDNDGDQDLFVGTRMLPGQYPKSSPSYLLINEGGKFIDRTSEINKELQNLGMVTSAKWSDYDNDGDKDLFIVGEWSGIKVFNNENNRLTNVSSQVGLEDTEGWWFHIKEIDFDKDGDKDFIVGNIGENHKFKTSKGKPFQVFNHDFDNNGSNDIVLAYHIGQQLFPVRGRDCSSEQMPFIEEKFPTFASFADAQMEDIFGSKLDSAYTLKASTFSSYILENKNGIFNKIKLPIMAQYSAITGSSEVDINGDNFNDLIITGNMFHTEAETSKADAGYGLCLLGNGEGEYTVLSLIESGFYTPGDAKGLEMIDINDKKLFVIANNNGKLQTYFLKSDVKK